MRCVLFHPSDLVKQKKKVGKITTAKMTQETQITPPPVMWAQRPSKLYLTICLENCKDPEIKIEPETIYFKGIGGTDQKEYEVTINLFQAIDPKNAIQNATGRLISLFLTKQAEGPYWPRLTKENEKFHWLKCDFNKWKDEDDSEDDNSEDGRNFGNVMRDMSYMSGPGDTKPKFDDLDDIVDGEDVPTDSDDDDLPDLD